jgi:hypothetical protein
VIAWGRPGRAVIGKPIRHGGEAGIVLSDRRFAERCVATSIPVQGIKKRETCNCPLRKANHDGDTPKWAPDDRGNTCSPACHVMVGLSWTMRHLGQCGYGDDVGNGGLLTLPDLRVQEILPAPVPSFVAWRTKDKPYHAGLSFDVGTRPLRLSVPNQVSALSRSPKS